MDIGSSTLPRTLSGWQSRDLLLNMVTLSWKRQFYRLGQVMLRKPGFVERDQAQDSTSRKLLSALGLIFSPQIKNLALHVCYKVSPGQRGSETQRLQAHQVSLTFREECGWVEFGFSYPLEELPLGSGGLLASHAFKPGVERATWFIFVSWWKWERGLKLPCRLPHPLSERVMGERRREAPAFLIDGGWHHCCTESWKLSSRLVFYMLIWIFRWEERISTHVFRQPLISVLFFSVPSPPSPSTPAHTHTHTHSQSTCSPTYPLPHFLSQGSPSLRCWLLVFKQSPRLTSGSRRVPWVKSCLLQ